MDKYEYKQRATEIRTLIESKDYAEAMLIADTIDWSRVKSVSMLTTVSDLYKINKQYEKSREVLLLAYERYPEGRTIVYSLCELSIKLDDLFSAVEYYKEFVRIAPEDTGRYILKYKLYEAQGVSLEERIQILEEFKSHDRREKWCYELAFLYHKAGSVSKCVEECDEIVLWFGNGKYVTKALELKMLHETLTPAQEDKYRNRDRIKQIMNQHDDDFANAAQRVQDVGDSVGGDTRTIPYQEVNIQVKTYDASSKFNTIDIQQEIAKSMKDLLEKEDEMRAAGEAGLIPKENADQPTFDTIERQVISEFMEEEKLPEVKPDSDMQEIVLPGNEPETVAETEKSEEIAAVESVEPATVESAEQAQVAQEPVQEETATEDAVEAEPEVRSAIASNDEEVMDEVNKTLERVMNPTYQQDEVPKQLADKLSQEYDGQITMVIPNNDMVEKQITGQLNFEDILAEWEKVKKDLEAKRAEELSKRVRKEAYCIISEFDAQNSNTTLADMEAVADAQIAREAEQRRLNGEEIEQQTEVQEQEEVHGGIVTNVEFEQAELLENMNAAEIETIDGAVVEDETGAKEEVADTETEELPEVEEIAEIEEAEVPEIEGNETEDSEAEDIEAEVTEAEADEDETEELAEIEEPVEADAEESVENEVPAEVEESVETETPAEVEESTEDEEPEETSEEESEQEEQESRSNAVASTTRELTEDERILFGEAINSPELKKQLASAIDKITLASYTGNVLITGNPGTGTLSIAKKLIKSVQQSDSNFSGKVAKVTGDYMNKSGVEPTFDRVKNGAIIIEGAGALTAETLKQMVRYLDTEGVGLIVVLEDTRKQIRHLFGLNSRLREIFNIEVDVDTMSDIALVKYAVKYAYEQEYKVDKFAELQLTSRVSRLSRQNQTVMLADVREIVDEAIRRANKKNLKHFFDIIVGKRYDDEDMIVLSERDFR